MTGDRMGFAFLGGPSVSQMMVLARQAESQGFDSLWMAETRITRDGFVPLAAIAGTTSTIRAGTGIVNVYTRGPVLTAMSFATLDEIAHGRIVAGLGTGSPLVLAAQGIPFTKPLTRLREYVLVIRRLLAGERVTFDGEIIHLREAQLEVHPSHEIPIYLGVTGPRALELAGELADGVLLNAFTPVEYVKRAVLRIEAGAARSGRTLGEIEIAGMLVVSADTDGRAAKDRIRSLVAIYLTGFPNIARETGLNEVALQQIREAGARAVSDEIVDRLVVAGTPDHCLRRIHGYRDAGMQLPILAAIDNLDFTIEALAPHGSPW